MAKVTPLNKKKKNFAFTTVDIETWTKSQKQRCVQYDVPDIFATFLQKKFITSLMNIYTICVNGFTL